jgi:hypothetical protein
MPGYLVIYSIIFFAPEIPISPILMISSSCHPCSVAAQCNVLVRRKCWHRLRWARPLRKESQSWAKITRAQFITVEFNHDIYIYIYLSTYLSIYLYIYGFYGIKWKFTGI